MTLEEAMKQLVDHAEGRGMTAEAAGVAYERLMELERRLPFAVAANDRLYNTMIDQGEELKRLRKVEGTARHYRYGVAVLGDGDPSVVTARDTLFAALDEAGGAS